MEIQLSNVGNTIHLAIAPAFLLVSVVTQLRVLSNRLARITDRSRMLEAKAAQSQAMHSSPASTSESADELQTLYRRMHLIHRAITLSAACALLICIVIVALFADAVFVFHSAPPVIGLLFVLAMLALIASFSFFLHEIFIAADTLLASMERKLPHPRAGLSEK